MHHEQPRRAWPLERAALEGRAVIAFAVSFRTQEAVAHAANWVASTRRCPGRPTDLHSVSQDRRCPPGRQTNPTPPRGR
jgi:hypothetical protein